MNIKELGQVFTPSHIVEQMLGLIQNKGRTLEPSCGDGAFYHRLSNAVGIEYDKSVINNASVLNVDFFDYPVTEKFDTIIGNPPYVAYKDIVCKDSIKAYSDIFDNRSNLYLFFIYKCVMHLKVFGELIFITPRHFINSTASIKLNEYLYSLGTITHFIDLGDDKVFDGATPNVAIWRFVKGDFSRKCGDKIFNCSNGIISFNKEQYKIKFSDLFFVKVGAVSGDDQVFHNKVYGDTEFVCSRTRVTGELRKMFTKPHTLLREHKDRLLNRKIKKFDDSNWWKWGRWYYESDEPRIYVNCKTRTKDPFFINDCKAYDGSVLAIFPKFKTDDIQTVCDMLNRVDWNDLGFICGGRYIFSQRALENTFLSDEFSLYQ